MGLKLFFSLIFIVIVISLLALYWFIPFSDAEFLVQQLSSNENAPLSAQALQFYPNMRFVDNQITYKIYDCPLQKRDDMLRALNTVQDQTVLSFSSTDANEEISIYCEQTNKIEEGLFIAGEGGPTNITKTGEYNLIATGKILLLRNANCPQPNIAIHELLHVLGFDHVEDSKDIMYPVSRCDQEISQSTIEQINALYAIPNYVDLAFENVTATMRGKYLDTTFSVRNNGLADAIPSTVIIYADEQNVKEVEIEELAIGHGRMISLTNIWVSQLSVSEITLEIAYALPELKKENNEVLLKVKN